MSITYDVTATLRQQMNHHEPIVLIYDARGNGGGNVPIVLESNQNHATAKETEVCPSLPASMGLGGGYVPMIVENMKRMTFNQISQSAGYRQDETSVSITCCGGSYGGGSETLVVTYQNVCGTLAPGSASRRI